MATNPEKKVITKLELAGVRLIFKNFSGNQTQFNAEGKREFCVVLTPEQGDELKKDGWNVRYLVGRAEGEDDVPYLNVAVAFDKYPPNISLVSSRGLTHLTAETVGILDWAEITNVDLILRPYSWEVNGKKGLKAYLKSMYVTIEEDKFAEKYSHLEQVPTDTEPQMRESFASLMEEGA